MPVADKNDGQNHEEEAHRKRRQTSSLRARRALTRLPTHLFRKRPDQPNLVLTRSWIAPHTTTTRRERVCALAFQAANAKARELRWIV